MQVRKPGRNEVNFSLGLMEQQNFHECVRDAPVRRSHVLTEYFRKLRKNLRLGEMLLFTHATHHTHPPPRCFYF